MNDSSVLVSPRDDRSLSRVHSVDLRLLGLSSETPGARLLDVGCGAGRHEMAARELPISVAACDLETKALNDGRFFVHASPVHGVGEVQWLNASALALPFAGGSFDAAICSETLEHVEDDVGALHELRRTVRDGGRLAISVPAYWPELALWAVSWPITHTPGGHIRIYDRGQILAMLRASGWRPYAVRYRHAFESMYWLLGALLGGGEPAPLAARAWRKLVNGQPAALIDRCERMLAKGLAKSIVVYATAA